jgi:hypothetical protein
VLDGVSIEQAEHMDAKETFAGRLTEEILESILALADCFESAYNAGRDSAKTSA